MVPSRSMPSGTPGPHRPCEGYQPEAAGDLIAAGHQSSSPLRGVPTRRPDGAATCGGRRPHRPCEGYQLGGCGVRGRRRRGPHRPCEGYQPATAIAPVVASDLSSSPLRGVPTAAPEGRAPGPHRVLIAPARGTNAAAWSRTARAVTSSSPLRGVPTRARPRCPRARPWSSSPLRGVPTGRRGAGRPAPLVVSSSPLRGVPTSARVRATSRGWPVLIAPARGTNLRGSAGRRRSPPGVLIAPARGTNSSPTGSTAGTRWSSSPLRGVPTGRRARGGGCGRRVLIAPARGTNRMRAPRAATAASPHRPCEGYQQHRLPVQRAPVHGPHRPCEGYQRVEVVTEDELKRRSSSPLRGVPT